MPAAISVQNLGKCYRVNHAVQKHGYKTLRESLSNLGSAALRRLKNADADEHEDFWALKEVSFDVEPGEVVGIIGRNGAGKSTLLKILSRITKPTSGQLQLRGRAGSLLEVGTGFHPELTGRENIYLNGSILGMSRGEIERCFDEIVAFAEIERFLDTPVKRYSSGMYVRLAFALAAHLEPEILVVDEVLAVGDSEFQKKCLGKMQDVAAGGRTVLFVSHQMAAVKRLCSRGIVIGAGRVMYAGGIGAAIAFYADQNSPSPDSARSWTENDAPGNDQIRLLEVRVDPASGTTLDTESGFTIRWTFRYFSEGAALGSTLEIRTADEIPIVHEGTIVAERCSAAPGHYQVTMRFPPLLNAGRYKLNLMFGHNHKYLLFRVDDVLTFELPFKATGGNNSPAPGLLRPAATTHIRRLPSA